MGYLSAFAEANPTFVDALQALALLAGAHRTEILSSPIADSERNPAPPEGVSRERWVLALSAFRAAVTIARRDDDGSWEEDFSAILGRRIEEAELLAVIRLVHDGVPQTLREVGLLTRERALPVVEGVSLWADLRVAGDDKVGRALVPVVLLRLEIDERDSVVAQIPWRMLEQLEHELVAVRTHLEWVYQNAGSVVPEWARGTQESLAGRTDDD